MEKDESCMADILLQSDGDEARIEELMREAFGDRRFERSVWMLRPGEPVADLCLVIRDGGQIVGSLRFWEVRLGTETILLLGPLAVQPNLRGKGFGRLLVDAALERAKAGPWRLVLVSGEPEYYPKFGFVSAQPYSIEWPGFIEMDRLQFYELVLGSLASLPAGPLVVQAK